MTATLIAAAAAEHGFDAAALAAFIEVEAGGDAFGPDGRPTILYEPHVAYRVSVGWPRTKLEIEKLAYRAWRAGNYPRAQAARWAQFDRCAELAGRDVAVQACSWGLGQVLGEGWRMLGLGLPADVERLAQTEGGQIDLMCRFLDGKPGLRTALAARDWAEVARLYNGAQHARHGYAGKLERAYRKHSGGATSPEPLRIGAEGEAVRRLQRALSDAGAFDGPVDGAFGPGTEAALRRYQAGAGLRVDGMAGAKTWEALADVATVAPVAQKPDTPAADWTATAGKVAAGASALTAAVKGVSEASEASAALVAGIDPTLVALGIGAGLALLAGGLIARRLA